MCHMYVPLGTVFSTGELLTYYVSLRGPGWSSTNMPVVVEVVIGVCGDQPGNYVSPTTLSVEGPNNQIKYYTSRCGARASYRVQSIGVRWVFRTVCGGLLK
jgi:hypothetical protein